MEIKTSAQKQAKKAVVKDSAWLKEGTMDDPLDFMSEGAIRRVVGRFRYFTSSKYFILYVFTHTPHTHHTHTPHTHTHTANRPRLAKPDSKKAQPFVINPEGKLVITEDDDVMTSGGQLVTFA